MDNIIFIKIPGEFINASREEVNKSLSMGISVDDAVEFHGTIIQDEYISLDTLRRCKFYPDQEGGVTIFDGIQDRHYPIDIGDFLKKLEGLIEIR